MENSISKHIPFTEWLIQVAEEKIIEFRFLNKNFDSQEEFIIFTIVWMRSYKNLFNKLKINKIDQSFDNFCKKHYSEIKDNEYLGMTINAISRESEIPRSTVKRIIEKLIIKKFLSRNINGLIIPTENVRDKMTDYRKYVYKSQKKMYQIFHDYNLSEIFDKEENF